MGRRAEHAGRLLRQKATEMRNGACGAQRLQDERGHRIEADQRGRANHASRLSQAVCRPPSPSGWGWLNERRYRRRAALRRTAGERRRALGPSSPACELCPAEEVLTRLRLRAVLDLL